MDNYFWYKSIKARFEAVLILAIVKKMCIGMKVLSTLLCAGSLLMLFMSNMLWGWLLLSIIVAASGDFLWQLQKGLMRRANAEVEATQAYMG